MHASDSRLPDSSAADAKRIYQAIFGTAPSRRVQERFRGPSAQLLRDASETEVRQYRHALDHVRDLEALEVAARLRGRLPLLSKQFHLMVHLAETEPSGLPHFVNDHDSLTRGVRTILTGGFRTAFKLAVGLVLLRGLRRA